MIGEDGEMRFLRKRDVLEAPSVSEKLTSESLLGVSIADLRLKAYNERAEGRLEHFISFSDS